MPDFMIPLLAFVAVLGLGGTVVVARRGQQKAVLDRLEGVDVAVASPLPPAAPSARKAMGILTRLVGSLKPSQKLQEELNRAGFHGPEVAKLYLGIKTVGILIGTAVTPLVASALRLPMTQLLLVTIMGAATAYFLPNFIVASRSRKRSAQVRLHLPDALDMLEICVSSGMGLETAWNAVAEELRDVSPVLADEMALTNLEIHLGASRAEAMRHMAQRTGGTEISSLVAIMVQTERFGTSIAQALQAFAGSMREGRKQRAEERAEKMAVKLIIPMVVFVFPAMMIVLAGPAGMSLTKLLKG